MQQSEQLQQLLAQNNQIKAEVYDLTKQLELVSRHKQTLISLIEAICDTVDVELPRDSNGQVQISPDELLKSFGELKGKSEGGADE